MRCVEWTGSRRLCGLWLFGLAVVAGLAACGGGGGSDGGSPPVDVSLTNQTALTRAAMVTAQSTSIGGSLGITASEQPGPQAGRTLGRVLLAGVRGGAAPRESSAALIGPARVDCLVSGFVTFTLDDRDNSLAPSAGDVLSATFSACSDVPGEVVGGGMTASYTQVVSSPLTVGASVTLRNFSLTDGSRSAAADGDFTFTYQEPSASVATLRMVVGNSLAMRLTTPVFSDTVTMLDGYTIDTAEDYTVVPPGGGAPGRSTTRVSGNVASAAAGGSVQVDTMDAIVQYTDDDYPRAGRLNVVGRNGSLQATALSTTQVRIEADVNGDGQFDASTTVPWTQLL